MPRGVKGAMYADDLVLWYSADDIGTDLRGVTLLDFNSLS